ncbi:protein-export membrane protein SecD [Candidatus Kaiserbacteria bacterium RIFCSPLOWO2_02_FULL_56_11]|uniref:Protein translocase subunit SecD n=1 Tax=Candidatus Kaiserbacteria bacterium RIFCSPHIGHO2_12_FULL_56_13 TaxID=1798505 RepID=A0A1F6EF62_9BACT|nr:MAG: protein-export membrane protein SecD [Candidatus Kaiserbacteria bacterium RIFCSPHIGHO2_12_FULL_56_13]OGG81663.1 MAG: protein-export membrane protein SecD [Candidatus Kaiserbacteria bacterium RIFCSPLOWO2_02_FULL_56_11]
MNRYRAIACVALVAGLLLTYFVWATEVDPESRWRFKLGLDLAGGTELIYRADMSQTASEEQDDALTALRDVIDRRVNLFGVAEPIVQTQEASTALGTTEDRLIVDLPGVTDIQAAVDALGETPVLEFKLVRVVDDETAEYSATGLTGRYLEKASLQFASGVSAALAEPQVLLSFDSAGAELFEKITSEHVGEMLAIFLDGVPISTPVIQEAIPGGQATVSGNFTATQARDLVRNLNFGALPVPIILESSSAIGPSLGAAAIDAGVLAGLVGFALIALFMILWYRLPGLIAVVALVEYLAFMLAVIKVVPVTLTASGIAGLIITLGMAVDANVLISERMKEELKKGEGAREAVRVGFARAWSAIRDGHLTMLISGVILFWLGTSIVQGFALVFVLGVLASLISAVTLSRVFLLAIVPEMREGAWRFLMGSGFRKQN